jgi:hypothetical protein
MPKQHGGFMNLFSSKPVPPSQETSITGNQIPVDHPIHVIAKQIADETAKTVAYTTLAGVNLGKGAAEGAASQATQAGINIGSEAVKAAGQVGAQSIDTTSALIISSLKGLSSGGKVFAEQMVKHALLASERIGVAALKTTETVGEAITAKPVQDAVKGAVERTAQAGFLTVEDAALLAAVAAKYGEKALLAILAGASGGGRRRRGTRHRGRNRGRNRGRKSLKRRTAKHR